MFVDTSRQQFRGKLSWKWKAFLVDTEWKWLQIIQVSYVFCIGLFEAEVTDWHVTGVSLFVATGIGFV